MTIDELLSISESEEAQFVVSEEQADARCGQCSHYRPMYGVCALTRALGYIYVRELPECVLEAHP